MRGDDRLRSAGRLAAVSRRRLLNGEGRGWGPTGDTWSRGLRSCPASAGVLGEHPGPLPPRVPGLALAGWTRPSAPRFAFV